VGGAAIVIVALSGCTAPVVSAASKGGALPTASASLPGVPIPSDSASSAAASSGSAVPPVAPVAPVARPTVFSGGGGTSGVTVPITKPAGATTVVATITGGAAGSFFGVSGVDGSKEVLVGARGLYRGSTLLDEDGGKTTVLHVFSRGPWTIALSDPRSAPLFTGSFSGSGDAVGVYQGNGGTATVTGGTAGARFQIAAYGAGGLAGTLFSGTDGGSHPVRWPGGVALIKVRAVGPWSISIT
jgi:hypothetical protein